MKSGSLKLLEHWATPGLLREFFTFIYNCIPETDSVSMVHSVAAVLYLQFVLHVMLFRMLNMFCTFTLALSAGSVCAVPSTAVLCCF